MIHIYTGDGKGKTTAAIGLAVRMAGYDKKVLVAQFLKGSRTGELALLNGAPNVTVIRCGQNCGFVNAMSNADKDSVRKTHNENLFCIIDNMARFDMIVLDEIFDALGCGLADAEAAKHIAENFSGELVMTGRNPDKYFTDAADYITEMKKVKHPYDKGVMAREGIEY